MQPGTLLVEPVPFIALAKANKKNHPVTSGVIFLNGKGNRYL
jgi:hypothetical protein